MLHSNSKTPVSTPSNLTVNGCLLVLMVAIYHQVIYTEYVFTDEAHQLWTNQDTSNFLTFYEHGRAVTAYLFQNLFSSINSIEELRLLRLFSFVGWLGSALVWFGITDNLQKKIGFPVAISFLFKLFVITCLPMGIYIGWSSCLQLFLACTTAFLSGYLLLGITYKKEHTLLVVLKIVVVVFLGITSLFTYQTGFCCFILPFLFYFFYQKKQIFDQTLITAVGVYFICFAAYYFLFKYSLTLQDIPAAKRTDLSFNISSKLHFIYTTAIKRATGFNIIYRTHHLFSKLLIPTIWIFVLAAYINNRSSQGWGNIVKSFVLLLPLPLLLYLPMLVVQEEYPSYRTLFALNLGLTLFFMVELERFLSKWNGVQYMTFIMSVLFMGMAYYNFNFVFVNPLKKEYAILKKHVEESLHQGTKAVHIIRPREKFYTELYSIPQYQDEYGLPSTFMPWTPEPLMKQLYFDKFHDRRKAQNLVVTSSEKETPLPVLPSGTLIIDIEKLLSGSSFVAK